MLGTYVQFGYVRQLGFPQAVDAVKFVPIYHSANQVLMESLVREGMWMVERDSMDNKLLSEISRVMSLGSSTCMSSFTMVGQKFLPQSNSYTAHYSISPQIASMLRLHHSRLSIIH